MQTYYEMMVQALKPYKAMASRFVANKTDPIQALHLNMPQMHAVMEEVFIDALGDDIESLNAVLANPTIQRVAGYLLNEMGLAHPTVNSLLMEIWERVCLKRAGEKTFEVSPGLAEHLFATEVKNVTCDLLRLPFQSIYVVVPRTLDMVIPKEVNQKVDEEVKQLGLGMKLELVSHDVKVLGMFITETNVPPGRSSFAAKPTLHPLGLGPGPGRSWVITVVAEGAPSSSADGVPDHTFYLFSQPLPEGATIEQALEIRRKLLKEPRFKNHFRADEMWERYFTWVMNLVLYLTYEPTKEIDEYWNNKEARHIKGRIEVAKEQGKKDKANRLREQLKEMNPERRLYVGRHHSRIEERVGPAPHEHHPLNVRVLVTGHWRNQPVGTGRLERKLIWIRPFWRGPVGAPISNARRIVV